MKSFFALTLLFSINAYACRTDSISIVRNTSLSLKKKEGKLKSMLSQNQVFGLPFSFQGKSGCVDRTGKLSSVIIKNEDQYSREVVIGFPESKFKKIKGSDHHYAILENQNGNDSIHLLTTTCIEQEVLFADSIVLSLKDLQNQPAQDLNQVSISMMIATGAAAQNLRSYFLLSDVFSTLVESTETQSSGSLQKPSVITSSSIGLPGQQYFSVSSSMIAKDLCRNQNLINLEPYAVGLSNPSFKNSSFKIQYKNNLLLLN